MKTPRDYQLEFAEVNRLCARSNASDAEAFRRWSKDDTNQQRAIQSKYLALEAEARGELELKLAQMHEQAAGELVGVPW